MSALKDRSRDGERLRELVRTAAGGDARAREELASLCRPRVRRVVHLSCGLVGDREDLVQTAVAQVMSALESFRGEASFWIWVDRIAVNVVRMHFRRRRWAMFEEYDDSVDERADPCAEPADELAERRRALGALAGHLAQLRPAVRLPLVLVLAHGYSVPEVAAILEISYEAAKKRIYRGRRELTRRLKDDPYFRQLREEMER